MLQRVQTLYMLASVVAILMMLIFPLGSFQVPAATYELDAVGLKGLTEGHLDNVMGWSIFITLIIMLLTPLICIFLFKKRWVQLRFLIFSSVLNLLYYGLFFYECHNYETMVGNNFDGVPVDVVYNYVMLLMPALSVFSNWMAFRGVLRDIALLKSLERLR